MKNLLLLFFSVLYSLFSALGQESPPVFKHDQFVKTWRICYALEIEDAEDTLVFQTSTPDCRLNDCGKHQWSLREDGAIDFVFTTGCNSGFNSVSSRPKRWVYIEKDRLLKFISLDGFADIYFVEELTEQSLVLIRRKDLE
nr:hypothetical protein [uncultured Brumimicrobium sp.]